MDRRVSKAVALNKVKFANNFITKSNQFLCILQIKQNKLNLLFILSIFHQLFYIDTLLPCLHSHYLNDSEQQVSYIQI